MKDVITYEIILGAVYAQNRFIVRMMNWSDSMESPLISIVMPVYNSETFVHKAIDSVLNQTYENWELIVVDDGSQDQSVEAIMSYVNQDNRIQLLKNEKNSGIAITRNNAINSSRGKYIAFLDSDDMWYPEKLEYQTAIMESKHLDFSCTSYDIVDEQGKIIDDRLVKEGVKTYSDLLKTNFIGCLTVMIKRELLVKYPMPNVKHEDYASWLNILKNHYSVFAIPKKLSIYTKREASVSANKFNTINWIWTIYRNELGLSKFTSLFYLLRFLSFATIKYLK